MDKSGAVANLAVILGPLILGASVSLLLAIPTTGLLLLANIGAGLGVSLLVVSKWPKLFSGDFLSFGPSSRNAVFQKCYLAAYGCIILSICSFIALAVSVAYA
jgi:hypothetical protein